MVMRVEVKADQAEVKTNGLEIATGERDGNAIIGNEKGLVYAQ